MTEDDQLLAQMGLSMETLLGVLERIVLLEERDHEGYPQQRVTLFAHALVEWASSRHAARNCFLALFRHLVLDVLKESSHVHSYPEHPDLVPPTIWEHLQREVGEDNQTSPYCIESCPHPEDQGALRFILDMHEKGWDYVEGLYADPAHVLFRRRSS